MWQCWNQKTTQIKFVIPGRKQIERVLFTMWQQTCPCLHRTNFPPVAEYEDFLLQNERKTVRIHKKQNKKNNNFVTSALN